MEKIKIKIEGMTCGHCENAVQDAVRKLPGVKNIKANKDKKEAAVEYDSSLVTQEQIISVIKETGYNVIL